MLAIFWHSENSNENLFVGDYLQMFCLLSILQIFTHVMVPSSIIYSSPSNSNIIKSYQFVIQA